MTDDEQSSSDNSRPSNQIRDLIDAIQYGDLTAIVPLLDRLAETGDERRFALESALGRFFEHVAEIRKEFGAFREFTSGAATDAAWLAYRRRALSRLNRDLDRIFWREQIADGSAAGACRWAMDTLFPSATPATDPGSTKAVVEGQHGQ